MKYIITFHRILHEVIEDKTYAAWLCMQYSQYWHFKLCDTCEGGMVFGANGIRSDYNMLILWPTHITIHNGGRMTRDFIMLTTTDKKKLYSLVELIRYSEEERMQYAFK